MIKVFSDIAKSYHANRKLSNIIFSAFLYVLSMKVSPMIDKILAAVGKWYRTTWNFIKDAIFLTEMFGTYRLKWQNLFLFIRYYHVQVTLILIILVTNSLFKVDLSTAADPEFLNPIGEARVDDDNLSIRFPGHVFFDDFLKEYYVINHWRSRVVVFGPDLFPRISIGASRGVRAPAGLFVTSNGDVYIPQIKNRNNPRPSITILNGAFLLKKEIFLDQIPELVNLQPGPLAVKQDGTIYLTGENYRGVIVLNSEGNYLRTIQPEGQVSVSLLLREEEKLLRKTEQQIGESEETSLEEEIYANIPEEYRPRSLEEDAISSTRDILAPLRINYVTFDKQGNIYLLAPETGNIYVYDADENFLFSFGTKGGSPGQMSFPRSLAIDEKFGFIYVVDYMRHSILTYNMTGEYLFEFGGRGYSIGYFNYPKGIVINHLNQLFVSDYFNRRVQLIELTDEVLSFYSTKFSAAQTSQQKKPDTGESADQDQNISGEPESLGIEKNDSAPYLERPSDVIEEETIEK